MSSFRRPQFVVCSSFVMSLSLTLIGMIVPLFSRERLGATASLLGLYGTAFVLLYIPAALYAERVHKWLGFRGAVGLGAVAGVVAAVCMLVIRDRYLVSIVCLLQGVAGGLFWPAIESANAEGQNAGQIKRGVSWFSVSWVAGMMLAGAVGGWLYERDPMAPFIVSAALSLSVALAALGRRWFDIAPWRIAKGHDNESASTERRRLFVRLAFLANFALWTATACGRLLLPEYAHSIGLTGLPYGLILSAAMLGFLASNTLLTHWRGWHYSGSVLVGALVAAAGAMAWFTYTPAYAGLFGAQFALGMMMALTYYSSLYYGMELGGAGTGHGGRHEAVIGLAVGIGPLLGGQLIAWTRWPRSAFLAAGAFVLVVALVQAAILACLPKRAA